MTKEEAAAVFSVPVTVPLEELRRKFEGLHTDYQIRLTNAPTPALKKTYQQKLQELVAAGDVLHPGFSASAAGADLPSAEPMLNDLATSPGARTSSHTASRSTTRTVSTRASADGQEAGLPRSTMVAGACAVVLAAALSFAVLRWTQASTRAAALQAEGEKLLQTSKALQARVDDADRLLFADRLRVRNASSKTAKIVAALFVYRDQSGAMKMVHSGNFNYPTWEIRPGNVVQLDVDVARGRVWDGPVIYYSFLVEYPDVEPFLRAGIWAEDVDRLDKAVTLDLD